MKLLSVTVKNYRIHKDLTVTFDAERTVIGGANEAGKSTLVEAIHNALFLRSRATGTVQKAMLSEFHTGHPTVEVRFEAGNFYYTVTKVFTGNASASTTLKEHAMPAATAVAGAATAVDPTTVSGGRTLHGDEAEARIHEILGADDIGGGRNLENRIRSQWSHLWIWQGSATDDPLTHANSDCHAELLRQRLSRVDGGGVLESALDAAAARDIAARLAATFTEKGCSRPKSDLGKAEETLDAAEAAHAHAAATVETLSMAVDTIDSSNRTIMNCDSRLAKVRDDLDVVRIRQREAAAIDVQIAEEQAAVASATAAHADAARADAEIVACRAAIVALQARMDPELRALAELEHDEMDCTVQYDKDTTAMMEAGQRQAAASAAFALHDVREKLERLIGEREGLGGRCDRIAQQRQKAKDLEGERARVPAVAATQIVELSRFDRVRESAEATLSAIATRVEVLAASEPVTLAGAELAVGSPVTITGDAELAVGGTRMTATVRISPGGGRTLADATRAAEEARAALVSAMVSLGVESLEAARECHARRQSLDADIHAVNLAIEGLGGDQAEADLRTLDAEIEKVSAEVQRRSPEGLGRPASLSAAQTTLMEAERELATVGEAVALASASVESTKIRLTALATKRQQMAASLQNNRTELELLHTRAIVMEERHGADRNIRITELDNARLEATMRLVASRERIRCLAPEALELDRLRLERALANLAAERQEAETKRQLARARLELEGTTDPREDLARATARRRLAAREHASAVREGEAVKLLAVLFGEKKREVESQYVAPLTNRVSNYLERLYGEGTSVGVSYEDGRFSRLTLARRGLGSATFDFQQLSSGAREQVAAAFRLAMAEVLAEQYDGCLPVVFDDAFVNSDEDRQHALQRLLDLAASRGVQVIVLACRPDNYATLGGVNVTLRDPPSAVGGPIDPR